jgi:phage tail-like protein
MYVRDPLRGFRFSVSIAEFPGRGESLDIGFTRVGELGADVGIFEYQEISDAVTVHKLPDRIKFTDLVLERGATTDRDGLWNWFVLVAESLGRGDVAPSDFRRTVTISLYDKGAATSDEPAKRWIVFDAFPKGLRFSELGANDSTTLIETLTLAHEGFRVVPPRNLNFSEAAS